MISETSTRIIGADEIADALGRPRPTAQQREVIESPLTPALVVAGAGSGKTETMASRVLWLLANRMVQPGEILGLTFTRKAAGELGLRIRERIAELHTAGLITEKYDEFDPPIVATYNSFSNRIYRDNAMLIGRESDGAVLGEASAWQLARSIVISSTDERLPTLDKNIDSITRAVLAIARGMSENVVDPAAVSAFGLELAALEDLPLGGKALYDADMRFVRSGYALPVLVELAGRYQEAKQRRGFVEYSDQVALALQIVRGAGAIADELRTQHRVVLLDEYQDTSVVQTWLLAELFAGHPVMAVGDPNQSIYGWRGASAANLDGFARQFGATGAARYALSTSWRNGHDVLAVANALVAPLSNRVTVGRLDPGPSATARPVEVLVEETLPAEAEAVAVWLKRELRAPGEPSAAILFRARKTQGAFIEALRRHGVPFHVLGIGGLMAEPDIADLVSALSVINDPTAGSELVRLLAGSRWRLGARDLHALSRLASWLRDRDYAQKAYDDELKQRLRESVAEAEGGSIVDALDFVATAREGHTQLAAFSEIGLLRLREAGETFARLRRRAGLDLVDFVTFVEQDLQLDIEVAANETRSLGSANREAFFDALSGYLAVDETASLGGFLSWLREAEWRDGLSPRPEEPEPGTVQLLTIHGAKGLEWDLVVVPRLAVDELPSRPQEGFSGWLSFGSLPYEFRGDSAELPTFDWRAATTRKELVDEQKRFKTEVRARHEQEERRLAYVAVTRARHALLLTTSFWSTQIAQRQPSPFLRELVNEGVIGELPLVSQFAENPLGEEANLFSWPPDPLGGRRAVVQRAADLVREAEPAQVGPWQTELLLLLEERRRRIEGTEVVELPSRVPASRFKDFVTDPASVAASLRRPMPERPYRATRLGTRFHDWIEQRLGAGGTSEVIDAGVLELDDVETAPVPGSAEAEQGELQRLVDTFERSRWAGRSAV
ncbi:MAG: ATP-dependent helicase, partial [Microbacteriaceae bacterium]|nr:ATP-dependent helicase [Microbacteriaceae bacterium]